jgi:hypothetical protein
MECLCEIGTHIFNTKCTSLRFDLLFELKSKIIPQQLRFQNRGKIFQIIWREISVPFIMEGVVGYMDSHISPPLF